MLWIEKHLLALSLKVKVDFMKFVVVFLYI